MATEIFSTKDGKIHFRIKALKMNLLGKLSLVEAGFQRPNLTDGNKYGQERDGQAFPYFMPWLSGDGGSYSIFPS